MIKKQHAHYEPPKITKMRFRCLFLRIVALLSFLSPSFAEDITVLDQEAAVRTVAFSSVNGFRVASAGDDNTIKIWNLRNDTVIILKGHTGVINSVAFSPDGRLLASGGENRIKLWNLHQRKSIATLEHIPGAGWGASPVQAVTFSPDGKYLASAGYLGVKLWDVRNYKEVATLQHDDWVLAVAFSPDGQMIATQGLPGVVKVWNIQSRKVIAQPNSGQLADRAVAFSPDSRTLVSVDNIGRINFWDTSDWKFLGGLQNNASAFAIDFSPNGKTLATTGYEVVNLWSVESGDKIVSLTGHTGWVRSVAFTPAGNTIASGGDDGTVRVQKIKTHLEAQPLRNIVRLIYFLPNDRQPQPDIDAKLDGMIKESQQLFAKQMEVHGLGRKTFSFETDTNGKAVVHHITGQFTDEYYNNLSSTMDIWEEINERFDTSNNFYLTAIDLSNGLLHNEGSEACGLGNESGKALLPAFGHCFNSEVITHELGHAFGLFHDYRTDAKRIRSHTDDPMLDSFCSAEWLDVHRAFNAHQSAFTFSSKLSTIKMLPPNLGASLNAIRLRFEVTDPDGLYQAHLFTSGDIGDGYQRWIGCKSLKGKSSSTVKFGTTELGVANAEVWLQVVDIHGNITVSQRFSIDVTPLLPPPKTVSMPDVNLAAAVQQEIGNPITTHTILNLERLDVHNRGITDLTGLEHAHNLGYLNLGDRHSGNINSNLISNFSPLKGLTRLHTLMLNNAVSHVSDLSVLAELPQLLWLELGKNAITDVTPLTAFKQVEHLWLQENAISDVSVLSNLTQLRDLHLNNNAISDISALAGLKHLRVLSLYNNSIPDITPLAGLTRLLSLQLSDNLATDIAPLARLTQLKTLDIGNTGISDISALTELIQLTNLTLVRNNIKDLTPLKKLTNLTSLQLGANQVIDITPLVELANLDFLSLYSNQITDIMPLAELENLKELWLNYNQIADISPLINLVRLERLGLAGNPIQDVSPLRALVVKTAGLNLDILHSLYSAEKITGPWLWIIAPTEIGRGGAASIDVDSIDIASNGALTENHIATNGARPRDTIGDYVWALGELAGQGDNNVNDLVNKIGFVDGRNPATSADDVDINDHSAYALITLESAIAQPDVTMLAGSDDAIKIWLNGEVIHKNQVNRGATDFQDIFKVDLKVGDNLLLVKVSELTGGWSMFVGIDADVKVKQQFTNAPEKIAAAPPSGVDGMLPRETALLPNYPNPFNPETWIPYRLAESAEATVHIYATSGALVRTLTLGHQPAGIYQSRSHAAYWDGKNELGEPVASGIYFYTLTAGDFNATRKMLIRK